MKKILLSMAVFTSVLNSASAQSQRMVLIEEFTQASCGPCASQNPTFNALLASNMEKVVQIKYQTSWPGSDPMNAQNPADVATRVSRYGVSGVPFGVMDGDTNKLPATSTAYAGAPAGISQATINTEYAIAAPLSMNVTYAFNTVTDSITSVVTITNTTPTALTASLANSMVLEFALVEMNVKFSTAPGSNGEKEFYYVMRKMFPSAAGTVLPNTINAGQTLTFTFKEKAPSYIYDKKQMAVVAFVQDLNNNKVHQAAYGRPANVLDVKLESQTTNSSTDYCGATINPIVKITNKTNTVITSGTVGYTINGAAGGSQAWSGSLANGASTTVTMPAIVAPVGTNIYSFFFNSINNGAIDIMESDNVMPSIGAGVVGNAPVPFIENFESTAFGTKVTSISINNKLNLPAYVVDKSVSTNATDKLGAYASSDKSFRFNFYNIAANNNIGLIFYKNNVNGKGFKSVTFDWAYNHYIENGTPYFDALAIKASTDCGKTWTEIYKNSGEALRTTTVTPTTAAFYPKAAEWKSSSAGLGAFENATELLIMFEGQSSFGNNLYIDNIQFANSTSVETQVKDASVSVYPNPANTNVNVEFKMENAFDVAVIVTDVTGKVIYTDNLKNVTNSVKTINTSGLANGVYNLRIIKGTTVINEKITVAH